MSVSLIACQPRMRGAVEAEAVLEDRFLEVVGGDGEVLPDAGEIHEAQVDRLDFLFADECRGLLRGQVIDLFGWSLRREYLVGRGTVEQRFAGFRRFHRTVPGFLCIRRARTRSESVTARWPGRRVRRCGCGRSRRGGGRRSCRRRSAGVAGAGGVDDGFDGRLRRNASLTAISSLSLGSRRTWNSVPRYTSVKPRCRPQPRTSLTVIR